MMGFWAGVLNVGIIKTIVSIAFAVFVIWAIFRKPTTGSSNNQSSTSSTPTNSSINDNK